MRRPASLVLLPAVLLTACENQDLEAEPSSKTLTTSALLGVVYVRSIVVAVREPPRAQ